MAGPGRIGQVAAERIAEASLRRSNDPLGIRRILWEGPDRTLPQLVMTLGELALAGHLPIEEHHARAPLHPVTQAMLRLAGVDPDAFAVLAAMHVGSGLYIDSPEGWTLAKAVNPDGRPEPDTPQHVRVRLGRLGEGTRLTWWQHVDGRCEVMTRLIPETMAIQMVGRPLSVLMDDPAPGAHALHISELKDVNDDEGRPGTLVVLREQT